MRPASATTRELLPAAGLALSVGALVVLQARRRRERAQAERVLADTRDLALTDALSGLPNRRALDDALARMVAQSRRASSPLSVVLLDLDRFKQINDRHGHTRGDEVLAGVSLTLRRSVRASDVVARLGGDEFVVLLPDTAPTGALVAGEKFRAALQGRVHPGIASAVTASIGIATFPRDADDADALLQQADRAMYTAKRAGRNVVRAV